MCEAAVGNALIFRDALPSSLTAMTIGCGKDSCRICAVLGLFMPKDTFSQRVKAVN